jgi:hypothetical protein
MTRARKIRSELGEKVNMQVRIGPENPGLSRFVAARFMLLVVVSFYLAGAVILALYALGAKPLQ